LLRGVGFSQTEVGTINKVFGLFFTRRRRRRLMPMRMRPVPCSCSACPLTNLGAWLIVPPGDGHSQRCLPRQGAGGMGATAFGALVMAVYSQRDPFRSARSYRPGVSPAGGACVAAMGWGLLCHDLFHRAAGLLLVFLLQGHPLARSELGSVLKFAFNIATMITLPDR
jgi:hypothetical protein